MSFYSLTSKGYDVLDKTYFREKGNNPRKVIESMIPNSNVKILDMCCGTLSNTISIAEKCPNVQVMGVDLSKEMLSVARQKCRKRQLSNVYLKCSDATSIAIKGKHYDYVVIGLILHECSPELREGVLREAYRLLKEDGTLIILEWERPQSRWRRIKYAPLYLCELLYCKFFKEFYVADKEAFLKQFYFRAVETVHCNYSVVMKLKKVTG